MIRVWLMGAITLIWWIYYKLHPVIHRISWNGRAVGSFSTEWVAPEAYTSRETVEEEEEALHSQCLGRGAQLFVTPLVCRGQRHYQVK